MAHTRRKTENVIHYKMELDLPDIGDEYIWIDKRKHRNGTAPNKKIKDWCAKHKIEAHIVWNFNVNYGLWKIKDNKQRNIFILRWQ